MLRECICRRGWKPTDLTDDSLRLPRDHLPSRCTIDVTNAYSGLGFSVLLPSHERPFNRRLARRVWKPYSR